MPKATSIIIKDNETHRNMVHGSHNGVRFDLPVGKEIEVNEGVLAALGDSGISFSTVEGAGEGSSASSTEVLPGTAYDESGPLLVGVDGEPRTLSQVTDPDATDAGKTQAVNVVKDKGNVGATVTDRGLAGGAGAANMPLTSPRDDASPGIVPPSQEEAKKAEKKTDGGKAKK